MRKTEHPTLNIQHPTSNLAESNPSPGLEVTTDDQAAERNVGRVCNPSRWDGRRWQDGSVLRYQRRASPPTSLALALDGLQTRPTFPPSLVTARLSHSMLSVGCWVLDVRYPALDVFRHHPRTPGSVRSMNAWFRSVVQWSRMTSSLLLNGSQLVAVEGPP